MFCMKTIAIRKMRNTSSFKGCSVSTESGGGGEKNGAEVVVPKIVGFQESKNS